MNSQLETKKREGKKERKQSLLKTCKLAIINNSKNNGKTTTTISKLQKIEKGIYTVIVSSSYDVKKKFKI